MNRPFWRLRLPVRSLPPRRSGPLTAGREQLAECVKLDGQCGPADRCSRLKTRSWNYLKLPGPDLPDFGRKCLEQPEIQRDLHVPAERPPGFADCRKVQCRRTLRSSSPAREPRRRDPVP